MNFSTAKRRQDKINSFLQQKGFESYVKIVHGTNRDYTLKLVEESTETLPTALYDRFQPVKKSKEYVKQTPTTPSSPGKWIDKPLSPANRNYDGAGAGAGIRRCPEIQDMVKYVANTMNISKSIQKRLSIVASLLKIAEEPTFEGGWWMPVAFQEAPSYQGGNRVYPMGGLTKATTKEKATAAFDQVAKSWRGKPSSTDSLNLVWFEHEPISLSKAGKTVDTLHEFLAQTSGKLYSSIGSSLR